VKLVISLVALIILCGTYSFADTKDISDQGNFNMNFYCVPNSQCSGFDVKDLGNYFIGTIDLAALDPDLRTLVFFTQQLHKYVLLSYTITVQQTSGSADWLEYEIHKTFDALAPVFVAGPLMAVGTDPTNTSGTMKYARDVEDDISDVLCSHEAYLFVKALRIKSEVVGPVEWTVTYTVTVTV